MPKSERRFVRGAAAFRWLRHRLLPIGDRTAKHMRSRTPSLFCLAIGFCLAPIVAHAQFPASDYAQRRAALMAQIPEGIVVALGAHEPSQDYLSFYQSPSFNYLTGYLEPDAVLVMTKTARGGSSTLFVEPRVPAREVWVGAVSASKAPRNARSHGTRDFRFPEGGRLARHDGTDHVLRRRSWWRRRRQS